MPFFRDRMLSQATSYPSELSPSSQAKYCSSSVFCVRIQTLHVGTRRFFTLANACILFCIMKYSSRVAAQLLPSSQDMYSPFTCTRSHSGAATMNTPLLKASR